MITTKPTIAITVGDPMGIGPEIIRKCLSDPKIARMAHWCIFGETRKKRWSKLQAGRWSFQALTEAVLSIKNQECQALVTGPVSKTHLKLAGFKFPGQTEFLAGFFHAKDHAMMMASPRLRVTLVSIHLPLRKAIASLTSKKISEKIKMTYRALQTDFGIPKPRIAVCGLNPHAGEKGAFGGEESRIILPAIRSAQRAGIQASGPYAPDTVFHWATEGRFDAVICHYHDQGLIPIKTTDFYGGVNVTLGLPIVRTSPDHGPAFDIAGKKQANPSSMKAAMELAFNIWQNRHLLNKSTNSIHVRRGGCLCPEP